MYGCVIPYTVNLPVELDTAELYPIAKPVQIGTAASNSKTHPVKKVPLSYTVQLMYSSVILCKSSGSELHEVPLYITQVKTCGPQWSKLASAVETRDMPARTRE